MNRRIKTIAAVALLALVVPSVLAFTGHPDVAPAPEPQQLNDPPTTPSIEGPSSGKTGTSYQYTFVSTDPNGDDIHYCYDWGDGDAGCTNYFASGDEATVSHTWSSDGDYTLEVYAEDRNGAASDTATMTVSMPLVFGPGTTSSHTVLAEYGTTTWCPSCPPASQELYKLYSQEELPFHYVTLVYDQNPIANKRGQWLSDSYIPMLYLDGGYEVVDSTFAYDSSIQQVAGREAKPVSINVAASWQGNAKIEITTSITNEGTSTYIGHVRVYVTEITSRWNDVSGSPYHYALLDYALNTYVSIPAGETYEETTVFDGAAQHGNQTYGDITPDNIQVVASTAHWLPHLQKNPWTSPRPYRFFAQFSDDAAATAVEG